MGFLSSLFNPDPANLFGGDKGDFVNNALDPIGGFLESNPEFDPWGAAGLHEDVGAWMDDIGDSTEQLAKSRSRNVHREQMSGNMFKRDALTGFTGFGGSPIGTRFTNKINAEEDRPLWDMYGGATPDDYAYGESKGQEMNNQRGLDSVGQTIGKGFLNAFTYGLGSTALDALNSYGYGDNEGARRTIKNGAKNWALNYLGGEGLDKLGASMGSTTGDIGNAGYGDYKSYYDSGGTNTSGGFSLGQQLGAGEYSPMVNSGAKGVLTGAAGEAANGGNSQEIGKAALMGGVSGVARSGADMARSYLGGMFGNEDMPDVGTLGGTMQDENGENSATLGGETSPTQRTANLSLPTETRMQIQSSAAGSAPVQGPVEQFLTSLGIGGNSSTGMGMGDYAGLAGSVFGMYNANKQRKRLQEQQNQLANLFSANSPYAQMARQRMERKDAAAGRRSQYGPRETQLAALLADRMASTMPQQQKYADAIGGYDNMMVNNGMGLGTRLYQNRGKIGQDIDGLMRLFQGGQ